MLLCAKKVKSVEEGKKILRENIANGKGLKSLKNLLRLKVAMYHQ